MDRIEEDIDTKSEKAEGDRASALRVLGIFVGFVVIAGAVFSLVRARGGELDGEQILAEFFESHQTPPGFVLDGALKLPGNEELVTFRPAAASDTGIVELRFIRFPRSRAESVLSEQFQKLRFEGASGGRGGGRRGGSGRGRGSSKSRGSGGGKSGRGKGPKPPKLQDAGTLPWHGFEARFARLRHSKEDASRSDEGGKAPDRNRARAGADRAKPTAFHDTVRVNLTTQEQCLIGYVRFADGETGLVEDAGALLESFEPRSLSLRQGTTDAVQSE